MASRILVFLLLAGVLSGCQYLVSPAHAPAAVIGAYEVTHKRERWKSFAEKGDVYAQFELAESYRIGMLEGDINGEEAMKWYCEASRNGYAKAQVILGQLFENLITIQHFPIEQDKARAYMWYKVAQKRVSEDARQHAERLEPLLTAQEKRDADYLLQNPMKVPCSAAPLPWQSDKS